MRATFGKEHSSRVRKIINVNANYRLASFSTDLSKL